MWINSNTLVVYNYVYEIRQAFPETSFPEFPTDEDFETVGVYLVMQTSPPEYNQITQGLEQTVENIDGTWTQVWTVVELTPEQIQQNEENAKAANKQKASDLLSESDWTAIASVADPTESNPYLSNRQEFLAYRSLLRQIAVMPPVEAIFPPKPQEVWVNV